ncbi:hypothetical protein F511_33851 [Dorcoceras hygrometricum]|uniref:Uncharacterized protein n=1 Tax=Dorcoceras hygrometricum TaxID=472368 RepID=A0A2Z7BN28_9LAMI|nr:hypothetical protein F511_33851 [Dorcoceras hygrometricum]
MRHFNMTIIEVPSATPDLLIKAYTRGLRGGNFFNSLVKKPSKMFDELLTRVEEYVNVEEVQTDRRVNQKSPLGLLRSLVEKGSTQALSTRGPFTVGIIRCSNTFKVGKSRALEIYEERRLVKRPQGSEGGLKNPKPDKLRDSHRDYAHTTSERRHLDQDLEHIIQHNFDVLRELRKIRVFKFTVVDAPSSYNVIFGKLAIAAFMSMALALHRKIKFHVGKSRESCRGSEGGQEVLCERSEG